MNIRQIIGTTKLDDKELEATVEYFEKVIGGTIPASMYGRLREGVRQREKELFGAPKFESGQYGDNSPKTLDSNEVGEP